MPSGEDLSYLSPPKTVLGVTLRDMSLVTDTGVPLPPKGSPRHQTIERLVLVNKEDDAKEIKGRGVKALKRRRRQEAPSPPKDIESSKEI